MANTTFNTRIKLKYDTLANWTAKNTVLLKGEIALVEIPASNAAATTAPTVLMKVGDGTKAFNDLGYTSALAGDVYAWAKAATKPTYTANEITGLSDYISGEIQDTNTTYKIDFADGKVRLFAKEVGGEFGETPVATAEVPTYSLVTGSENGTVSFNGTDVAVKGLGSAAFVDTAAFDEAGAAATAEANAKKHADDKIGAVTEGKTVVDMINDAKTAATYDDTALSNRVKTVEDDYLKATDKTELSNATKAVSDELTKQKDSSQEGTLAAQIKAEKDRMDAFLSNAAVGDAAVDTLKEIQDYITSDGTAAAEVTNKIAALETAVGKNGENLVPVGTTVDNKIAALDLANTYEAKGTAATAKSEAIADAEGKIATAKSEAIADAEGKIATAKSEAITAAATDAADKYVAKEAGKDLSANDFTDALKTKVEGVEEGAQVNKIENIKVNGVAGTIANKVASVSISLDQVAANTAANYVIFDCGGAE